MAAVVSIISRRGLTIDASYRNQLNKTKLPLYSPIILHFNCHLQQCVTEHLNYKNNLKIRNIKMGVGIDHCHTK